MPEVAQNFDRERLKKIRPLTVKAAVRWLDMNVAVSNGDIDGAKGIYKHIRDITVEVQELLKAMGSEASQGGPNA